MSSYLDVAISLIAVYIAFSLLVSWINELVASTLQWRGKNLKDGISHMLGDPDALKQLYEHPIIAAVCRNSKLPQYIASRQFSTALLSYMNAASNAAAAGRVISLDVQWAIEKLPPGSLRGSLQSIYDQGGRDYTRFVHGIERWYDDQMDRVSGWYHQHATWAIIIIAAIIVPLLDVDTIHIIRQVSCQSALRAAIAQPIAASKNLNEQQIAQSVFANMTFGWNVAQEVAPCSAAASSSATNASAAVLGHDMRSGYFWSFVLLKILGFILTIIALALGAPFWFDLLKGIVNVRNAGNTPPPATQTSSA